MIKCPACQTSYPENTLFCEECGLYLAKDGRKGTDPLAINQPSWAGRERTLEEESRQIGDSDLSLGLSIMDSERSVSFPLVKEINIGRLDAASATFPDVDLTNDRGLEKGVSRRHAKITRRGNEVLIEDLGSVNGTFVNGKRLTPYLPHPLYNGDELQLGKLVLRVSF